MKKKNQNKPKKSYNINDIHVPAADSRRDEVEYKALLNALDTINIAKKEGNYSCYVVVNGYAPRPVIQKLIEAGYNLRYRYFSRDDKWFVEAEWKDGCCGRILKEDTFEELREVTIDEMFQEPFL